MGHRANQATLKAIRESSLVDPAFLRTYEEIYRHKDEDGVTGAELDDILRSQKAHAHVNVFRQYGMVERLKRRPSKHNGSIGWAYVATDVVPICRINWAAQKRPEPKAPTNGESDGHVGTRKLWKTINKRILNHYAPKLTGISPKAVELVLRDIAGEVAALQATITRRVDTAAERLETPGRRQLLDACEVLGVAPPRAGKPINVVEARRRMHQLARSYHPDLHGGDPRKDELFKRVADAFQVIERSIRTDEGTERRE